MLKLLLATVAVGVILVNSARAEVVPNVKGCPPRAFCGCATSKHIFHRAIRELYLAANWFRFPKAKPAPGMVAVRQHHVMAILEVKGNKAKVFDPNSGGHLTRIHWRSLVGFSVRRPSLASL